MMRTDTVQWSGGDGLQQMPYRTHQVRVIVDQTCFKLCLDTRMVQMWTTVVLERKPSIEVAGSVNMWGTRKKVPRSSEWMV